MEMTIGGRTFPLMLSSFETLTIQEEIGCTVGQLRDQVFGIVHNIETDEYRTTMREDPEKLKKFGKLIRIMGNAGLEEAGQEPDLTDKWILRHIKPSMLIVCMMMVSDAIDEAMRLEAGGEESGPVDEVLEEENRKKEPGSSPTGESAPADSSPG